MGTDTEITIVNDLPESHNWFPIGSLTQHYTLLQEPGKITARLTSLDDGRSMWFRLPPAEHDREYGAQWDDVPVCEADPEPSEYRHTKPETRSYRIVLDAYARPGGMVNTLEPELKLLKSFTQRAPKKVRSHRCVYTQGEQVFGPCVVERIQVQVRRIGEGGGALQAYDVTLELREIPGIIGLPPGVGPSLFGLGGGF